MKIKQNIALSDTGFIFDPSTGDSYSLNPIGKELMDLIRSGKNVKGIKEFFLKRYHVDENTLEKDIIDFMGMLKQYSLAEVETGNAQ